MKSYEKSSVISKRFVRLSNVGDNVMLDDFLNVLNRSPTSQRRHQHISSPTSVANIDVDKKKSRKTYRKGLWYLFGGTKSSILVTFLDHFFSITFSDCTFLKFFLIFKNSQSLHDIWMNFKFTLQVYLKTPSLNSFYYYLYSGLLSGLL